MERGGGTLGLGSRWNPRDLWMQRWEGKPGVKDDMLCLVQVGGCCATDRNVGQKEQPGLRVAEEGS